MKLIIQIPALNEAITIGNVIKSVPDAPTLGVDTVAFVVIDDGSTDQTGEIAKSLGTHVVRHASPQGVGAAFWSGLRKSEALGADIIVTIDADGQFNPADIPALIAPILANDADFVTASRFADPKLVPDMPGVKRWGNDVIARWISHMTGQSLRDVSCGFRAYSREAYLRLFGMGQFTYTHETILNLAFCGIRIQEVPTLVRGEREHGKSRVASNVFNYGVRAASIILRTYRDYRPLRFFWSMAAVTGVICLVLFGFLFYVKVSTGAFTPHKWAGFAGATAGGLSIVLLLMGVIAEMLDRIRALIEELLFVVRSSNCKQTPVDTKRANHT